MLKETAGPQGRYYTGKTKNYLAGVRAKGQPNLRKKMRANQVSTRNSSEMR